MFSKIIAKFEGEYKANIFGKKNKVYLYIYEKNVSGIGASYYDGDDKFTEKDFEVQFQNIKEIGERYIQENRCLYIDYVDTDSLFKDIVYTIYFPNLEDFDAAITFLSDTQKQDVENRRRKIEEEQEHKEKQVIEEQNRKEEYQQFYDNCYKFHIADAGNPYFKLQNGDLQFAGIYIDKKKNLNFVKIDGYRKEESNLYIPYDKIHYYERAGNVYYTSSINGHYSNYGGSFTGASISKGATLLGGLMGAALTYKPSEIEMPNNEFNISSENHRIDDRSVILNYYSDVKRQYMDVELPMDIYNFLQTYLPEKNYNIVIEIEKKNAIENQEKGADLIEANAAEQITQKSGMEEFENKIKKLKMMYDNGILTEEEFIKEKKSILSEI